MFNKKLFVRLLKEDEGQDLIEYAMLAAFVSLVAIAGATALGIELDGWYSAVATTVDGMATSGTPAGQ